MYASAGGLVCSLNLWSSAVKFAYSFEEPIWCSEGCWSRSEVCIDLDSRSSPKGIVVQGVFR